jgi:hypothetical protein
MASYLFIESRNPWEAGGVERIYGLARDLARDGHEVVLFLVQNGVLPARRGAAAPGLAALPGTVRVLADEFSLRERAIPRAELREGVEPAGLERVVTALAAGARAVFH